MLTNPSLRTWIEINKSAIAHNIKTFRSLLSAKTKLMAVIKSNAYGHNIHEFSRLVIESGADQLGVDSITEAIPLRKAGIVQPILVLGYTIPTNYKLAELIDVAITVSSIEQLRALCDAEVSRVRIHLKVDTGMCRQGLLYDLEHKETIDLLRKGICSKKFILEGLYTHLASAKAPGVSGQTQAQLKEFRLWQEIFRYANMSIANIHCAASAGTLLYAEAHFDMVRIGMGCYGYFPSSGIAKHFKQKLSLKPVLSWRSIVSEVKCVPMGMQVGYDGTCTLKRNSVLAVVPIGYWHGIGRIFSNNGHVLIAGHSARILGRVSMDMITVDVTDIPNVHMGTVVTLIGHDGREHISAEELGRLSNTTAYEVLTRINPLIERIVT